MPRASASDETKSGAEVTTRKKKAPTKVRSEGDPSEPAPAPAPTREPRSVARREAAPPAPPVPTPIPAQPNNYDRPVPARRAPDSQAAAPMPSSSAPIPRPQAQETPARPGPNGQSPTGGGGSQASASVPAQQAHQQSPAQHPQSPPQHQQSQGQRPQQQGPSHQQQGHWSGQQRPYGPNQGGQGMHPQQGSGRRKKKKRKGPGGPGGPGGGGSGGFQGHGSYGGGVALGYLPSDEELEREAAALEEVARTPDYKKAEQNALHISRLQRMEITELHRFAESEGLTDVQRMPRQELIFNLLKKKAAETGLIFGEGTLDIGPDGYGFLRSKEQSYLSSPDDIYVPPTLIRRNGLRKGMEIQGAIRPPRDNERYFALLRIDRVNGHEPQKARSLPIFEDLTPLHPEERFVLETSPDEIEMRIVDLVAPIGRGQRGLIVAPPRTGKTVLLQKITRAISKNYPEVKIIVLLIDERPEEVTDFRRNTTDSVEVVASTFDEDSSRHVTVAEMVIEKARRFVEFGEHVVILLDSITRLARAYNAAQPHSGKIMTGGIDSNALTRPKKFFGSARAIEHGGSLTILGTALVDTGSKADEVIFEEFKGTGNSELHLDRKLVEKRIWPAIDVSASGTRREELLLDPKELELTYRLRKVLADMNVVEALELLKNRLKKAKTNAEFLMTMNIG